MCILTTVVTEQRGFRKRMPTENAAFRLVDSVSKYLNWKIHVRRIFCDLSNTFDCITPKMLLAKLYFYRIWGVSEDWFSYCVTSRRQKGEVTSPYTTQNVFSDWGRQQCGVLQGSFLGHLFIIYEWPPQNIFCAITSIICWWPWCLISSRNFKDFCSVSNLVLSHVIKWFAAYHLVLNIDKTNLMKFMTNTLSRSILHIGSGFNISWFGNC